MLEDSRTLEEVEELEAALQMLICRADALQTADAHRYRGLCLVTHDVAAIKSATLSEEGDYYIDLSGRHFIALDQYVNHDIKRQLPQYTHRVRLPVMCFTWNAYFHISLVSSPIMLPSHSLPCCVPDVATKD